MNQIVTTDSKDVFMKSIAVGDRLQLCPWHSIYFHGHQVDKQVRVDRVVSGINIPWVDIFNALTTGTWSVPRGKYQGNKGRPVDPEKALDPSKQDYHGWIHATFTRKNGDKIAVAYKDNPSGTKSMSFGYIYKWRI